MTKTAKLVGGLTAMVLITACDSASLVGTNDGTTDSDYNERISVQAEPAGAGAVDSSPLLPDQNTVIPPDVNPDQRPHPLADSDTGSDSDAEPPATEPPVQPAQSYSASDITDLILITGQSNALGTETGYDASLDVPHKRAFAFTREGWQQANLHQVWDRNWFPGKQPGLEPSNNFAFHMARNTALKDSTRVVGIILVTDPGKRIENWRLHGTFWQTMEARVLDAINQLPHKSQLDGILWHQGESNAGESDYHEKLDQLINTLRMQSWFSAGKPFICGETAAYQSLNQQLMALNDNSDQWTGCVSSNGLTTQHDGFHFDAAGLRELGRRYADKYLAMTR